MLDYLVVYDSETGNTKKIATEIFASLPGMSKDLINLHERTDFPEAKIYFVGFCVHRGTCRLEIGNFLFRSVGQIRCSLWNLRCPETARNTTKRSHPASGSGLKMTITISVLLSARGKCRLLSVKNMNPC